MIDKNELNKINSMTDEQLREMIKQIATTSGANPMLLEGMLSDISSIRKAVSTLSQNDINKLVENVGEENAEKIADIFQNNIQRGDIVGHKSK